MEWLHDKFEAVMGFFVGAVGAVFVGGRAYQKIQSTQQQHTEEIGRIITRHDDFVRQQEATTGEIFRSINDTKEMVFDLRVNQTKISTVLDNIEKQVTHEENRHG